VYDEIDVVDYWSLPAIGLHTEACALKIAAFLVGGSWPSTNTWFLGAVESTPPMAS